MIELALPVALGAAAALTPGFVAGFGEGAHVRGPRPAQEVRAALDAVQPALDACAGAADADAFVDVEVLAAGFVDRVTIYAGAGALDEACITQALRTLHVADRGREPRTHALVHLAVRASGALPRPTPREVGEALLVHRDDVDRCIEAARREPEKRGLGGSLVVLLRVADERGRAEPIGGSLRDADVQDCVTRALSGVRVPGATDRAAVAWPLVFPAPPPRAPAADEPTSPWEAPTLMRFLGCAGAFPTT